MDLKDNSRGVIERTCRNQTGWVGRWLRWGVNYKKRMNIAFPTPIHSYINRTSELSGPRVAVGSSA